MVFYLTTPIYYVNDRPHLGHAYTTVLADILTRWHRQRGERVWFATGTDEHGEKVLRSATAHSRAPAAWVEQLVEHEWRPMLEALDAANDDFLRTTDPRHVRGAQEFWQQLFDRGAVYRGSFTGYYSVASEEFVSPDDVVDATEGDGVVPEEGAKVSRQDGSRLELVSEDNYFFRLSDYQQPLLEHYAAHPDFIRPESARNEVLSFVRGGLRDLSISRSSFDWGIEVPWDSSQVLYVWVEALLSYLTAVGYGRPDGPDERWPASVHVVGKDILRFHAVTWPAMLLAAGLPLPGQVFAHGWLLVGGQKMSKSRANGIHPSALLETFGSDAVRYYFARALPFGVDGSVSWEDLHARYSADLANGLGNLASRTTAMVVSYFDGSLPAAGPMTGVEQRIAEVAVEATLGADAAVERLAPHDALAAVWQLVDALNGYLTTQRPWELAKDQSQRSRLATVLHTAAEGLRVLCVLLHPVLPRATQDLWSRLGADRTLGALADQHIAAAATWGQLPPGSPVRKGDPLFPRIAG